MILKRTCFTLLLLNISLDVTTAQTNENSPLTAPIVTVTEKVQCGLQSMEQENSCRGFGDKMGKTMWDEGAKMNCMCSNYCRILTLTCQNDSTWQGALAKCMNDTLPIHKQYGNKLKFNVTIRMEGSNIIHNFQCPDGLTLMGASEALCINGNLTKPLPKCSQIATNGINVAMKNNITFIRTAKNGNEMKVNETQEADMSENEDSGNANSYFLYIGIALSTIGLASILLTLYFWKRQWKSNRNHSTTRRENHVAEVINPTFQASNAEPDYDYPTLKMTDASTREYNNKPMEEEYVYIDNNEVLRLQKLQATRESIAPQLPQRSRNVTNSCYIPFDGDD